jgi:hypothetical protein
VRSEPVPGSQARGGPARHTAQISPIFLSEVENRTGHSCILPTHAVLLLLFLLVSAAAHGCKSIV